MDKNDWVAVALNVIRREAGEDTFARYRHVFEEIAKDQSELRYRVAQMKTAGNKEKEAEYRDAYDTTLLDLKNLLKMKKIDLSDSTLDGIVRILRIVFRVLMQVAIA